MHTRHAILLVCVLSCSHAAPPAALPLAVSIVVPGPTVSGDSLRVAATDSFGVGLVRRLSRVDRAHVPVVSDRDALDFIDSGGDVLVTDRPAVIRYATSRADFAVIALPWDRQYALLTNGAVTVPDVLDAVHADARVAQQRCPMDAFGPQKPTDVFYLADDSIARSLAERLVGLGVATRATPFSRATLVLSPLAEMAIATRAIDATTCDTGPDHLQQHALPLIDTRSHLIVRRGAVRVLADTSGGMWLDDPVTRS